MLAVRETAEDVVGQTGSPNDLIGRLVIHRDINNYGNILRKIGTVCSLSEERF